MTKPGRKKPAKSRARWNRIDRAYEFIRAREEAGESFTAGELAAAADWKVSSIGTYRRTKWRGLIHGPTTPNADTVYRARGIATMSLDSFRQRHSRRFEVAAGTESTTHSEACQGLLLKAREAALLGVAIYNNPTLTFRTAGFLVQMHIAWTALFHSVFERSGRDYVEKMVGRVRRTWGMRACMRAYFGHSDVAIRAALLVMDRLRNEIVHDYLPALDFALAGRCQAYLHNFEEVLVREYGEDRGLMAHLAVSLQCATTASAERSRALAQLQRPEYVRVQTILKRYQQLLPAEVVASSKYQFAAFVLPHAAGRESQADATLRVIRDGDVSDEVRQELESCVVVVKNRDQPVLDGGYSYLPKDVISEVERRTGVRLRQHDHVSAWRAMRVRPPRGEEAETNGRYCAPSRLQSDVFGYSEAWVKLLCGIVQDADRLQRLRTWCVGQDPP